MLNLEFFLFVWVPSVQNNYFYHDIYNTIRNELVLRNLVQKLLALTIVCIIWVNDQSNPLANWTFATTIFLIPFNLIQNVTAIGP